MFVPREVLAEILCRAELLGSMPAAEGGRASALDPVCYVPCPLCHSTMNRVNFGKLSGVIVDICRKHGTWFDGGELTRVVAFVAGGGLARTRARDEEEERERGAPSGARVELRILEARSDAEERLGIWRELLQAMLP